MLGLAEWTPAARARLLAALEHLLEAGARLRKRRALGALEERLTQAMQRAFLAQGQAFVDRLARLFPEGRSESGSESRLSERRLAGPWSFSGFPRSSGGHGSPDGAGGRAGLREQGSEGARGDENALGDAARWGPLFDDAVLATLALFREPLRAAAREALAAGARAAMAELKLAGSFSLEHPRAVAYLQQVGAERIAGITETTREHLRAILTQAAQEGWGYDQTARAIMQVYAEFAGPPLQGRPRHISSRAELIAVTELGDAYEAGNRAIADDLAAGGLALEKSWLIVGDERTCPICRTNAAVGWIPLAQPFPSGHQQPTGHPGCRCTALWQRRQA